MFQTRRLRVGNIMCAQNEAPGPVQLRLEYPLGDAERGGLRERVTAPMRSTSRIGVLTAVATGARGRCVTKRRLIV